jgi:hypothetical protein
MKFNSDSVPSSTIEIFFPFKGSARKKKEIFIQIIKSNNKIFRSNVFFLSFVEMMKRIMKQQ